MSELIKLLETPHPRNRIAEAMMSMTNGDLDAACNLEDYITKLMAVRFLYESIKKIP